MRGDGAQQPANIEGLCAQYCVQRVTFAPLEPASVLAPIDLRRRMASATA